MPPRPALFAAVAVPWRCSSCRHATRPFSTATQHRQTRPESPRYIDIPQPPQQAKPVHPRIRGTLPVPRDIFKDRRGGVEKVTPEYLAATTQDAKQAAPIDPSAPSAAYREWKQRMATRRRQNLREGLSALQMRRRRADRVLAARRQAQQWLRQEAINAPERDDERLTRSSTTALMDPALQPRGVLPDPNRERRLATMRENVRKRDERRSLERQAALHTLYMHARHFITTEEQLDAEIEKQFGTVEKPATFGFRGTSIWNTKLPLTLEEKLKKATGESEVDEDDTGYRSVTDRRLRKVAEELTGGKM